MEKKINIAELLKDCPKGTKLYSPLCGECRVSYIYDGLGFDVICGDDTVYNFSYDGRYNIMGECCIFPSKECRDWSKFQRPFKDGDVVAATGTATMIPEGTWIGIFKQYEKTSFESHCSLSTMGNFRSKGLKNHSLIGLRHADEEEKQKLFDVINASGYKWNAETKTLEKLNKNKFDIANLKPFDKVLVRDTNGQVWTTDLFSHIIDTNPNLRTTFVCIGHYPNQCIPYEGNECLLGKTNDCDEFYKTWE